MLTALIQSVSLIIIIQILIYHFYLVIEVAKYSILKDLAFFMAHKIRDLVFLQMIWVMTAILTIELVRALEIEILD